MQDNDDDARRKQISNLLLNQFNLRVEPEMAVFVLQQLGASPAGIIPIIGGHSKTGVAVRQLVAARELQQALNSSSAEAS